MMSEMTEADSEFKVNKPFIFIVHDKMHGINLLMGRYVNPQGDDVEWPPEYIGTLLSTVLR